MTQCLQRGAAGPTSQMKKKRSICTQACGAPQPTRWPRKEGKGHRRRAEAGRATPGQGTRLRGGEQPAGRPLSHCLPSPLGAPSSGLERALPGGGFTIPRQAPGSFWELNRAIQPGEYRPEHWVKSMPQGHPGSNPASATHHCVTSDKVIPLSDLLRPFWVFLLNLRYKGPSYPTPQFTMCHHHCPHKAPLWFYIFIPFDPTPYSLPTLFS